MIRKIVEIDRERCNGCGACASACHESAIEMIDGKATLIKDDYCDGLGDCLPACPADAISIIEREAADYDEEAVKKRQNTPIAATSQLTSWPVQIKLVPVNAPYFQGADLLIAADCTAYAYANFHGEFIKDRIALIGCPKLDAVDYSEKLTEIFKNNDIKSVTVVRMEVPCCGGLQNAAAIALHNCKKEIPWKVVTLGVDGEIRA